MIESALKGLRTNIYISNPKSHIFQLALDYDIRMEYIGYENFKDGNPRKAESQIVETLYLPPLRSEIMTDLDYITSLRMDRKKFLAYTSQKAEYIQCRMYSVA